MTSSIASTGAASTARPVRAVILSLMLVALVGCDQATKQYAREHFRNEPRQSYFGGLLQTTYAENPGAFLSLFAGLSDEARYWLLTVSNGVVLAGLAVYLLVARVVDRWTMIAWGLILAGGVGNLIDRSRYGSVIDFLHMRVGDMPVTGVFNVADIAITGGFVMLLPILFRKENDETGKSAEAAGGAPA